MRCRFGHEHPPEPLTAATHNRTQPWGPRPYHCPECSEVNFGDDVRVLRGGSWATDALVARTSFRRWESPERREAFTGFRCARDA